MMIMRIGVGRARRILSGKDIRMALEMSITTGVWLGDEEMILTFPDGWDVSVYESKGSEALDKSGIEKAFAEPIGTQRIEQLARGKKDAVIIVDDLSRPTPAHLIIPHIISEMKAGGIKEESIKFVVGGGAHRPLTEEEMAKKIGPAVASKYKIYSHNVFSKTLKDLGKLDDGTPVQINEIVAESDLKVAIGGIIPHVSAGVGGGGKIVVPGIASYDTIDHNHGKYKGRARGNIERQGEEKDMRDNAEDVARHVGLDFMANVVLTKNCEIAGLFAGDVMESHGRGKVFAKEIYDTVITKADIEATDIVVINAYPQDYDPVQMSKSTWPYKVFGDAQKVMINLASDGIYYHGMSDKVDYETFLKMKKDEQESADVPEKGEIKSKEALVLLTSGYPKAGFYRQHPDGAIFDNWGDLIEQLKPLYSEAKVAVIPYSPIQLPHIV